MTARVRTSIPIPTQVQVLFRDGWLCSLCRRPVVFPLALKQLDTFVGREIPEVARAYWNPQWRRDAAPLLDELAACIDHVEAFAKGGAHDVANFATACARCNARKSARERDVYLAISNPWAVKGKHGEPTAWDGLASVFVVLARHSGTGLTATERSWLKALEGHFTKHAAR